MCTFCDITFTGCSCDTFVIPFSLGRLLIFLVERFSVRKEKMFQHVHRYVNKEDDNLYSQFRTAQKVPNMEIMAEEEQLSTSRRKQTVLDLTSPAQRLLTGEIKNTKMESKVLVHCWTLPLLTSLSKMLCRSILRIRQV